MFEDGNMVNFDADLGEFSVAGDASELKARRGKWKLRETDYALGVLWKYA